MILQWGHWREQMHDEKQNKKNQRGSAHLGRPRLLPNIERCQPSRKLPFRAPRSPYLRRRHGRQQNCH